MKLGFLGTGAITSAMVTGLNSTGGERHTIRLSPRNSMVARDLANRFPEVSVASSNQEVVDECEVLVIAVRPQVARDVLSELRFRADLGVISLVSGLSVRSVSGLVAPAGKVTRAVPLPSTAQRRGLTAIYPPDRATVELFASLGGALAVDTESEFNALCTATATMAPYFAFADGVASWLRRHGVPQAKAREYIARIFSGLTDTALEAPERSFQSLSGRPCNAGRNQRAGSRPPD